MEEIARITQQLVQKPSFVDAHHNERRVADFIFSYLKRVPYLTVRRENVTVGRVNIIATSVGRPQLLLAAHMDTVEPRSGQGRSQFGGVIRGNRLFGLGAYDTKGGTAALLTSLRRFRNVSGLTLLFYCDEEYNFLGMKSFLARHRGSLGSLAVLSEPTHLKIWNAHRGLIELSFSVKGRSGHPAHEPRHRGAVWNTLEGLTALERRLRRYRDSVLGRPIFNVARFQGGLRLAGSPDYGLRFASSANNISDYAHVLLEVRTPSPTLRAARIVLFLERFFRTRDLVLDDIVIKHDLGALATPKGRLLEAVVRESIGKISYLDPSRKGYSDGQLLHEKLSIPVAYFGPAGGNAHAPGEWVDIPSLLRLSNFYANLLKRGARGI